jgi:hypothetical protein
MTCLIPSEFELIPFSSVDFVGAAERNRLR